MLILGDIACPTKEHAAHLKAIVAKHSNIFSKETILLNLEGLIADDLSLATNSPVLFNHSSVLESFPDDSILLAALANNHILDLPHNYDETTQKLSAKNIQYFGAEKSKTGAQKSIQITENGKKIVLINACWDFLLYHQKNPSEGIYINTIAENKILNQVHSIKSTDPEAHIVIYFHWSFDLEILPFPMYRQFAMDLIDAGVNLVVGAHSHCVQGGETYKEGYIVYGLGNFYLPSHTFANGTLKYPEMSKRQLVLQWNSETNQLRCQWFDYSLNDGKHDLNYITSEDFSESKILKNYSPFQGMEHKEYIAFFKKNRRKKIAIPLFKDYKNRFSNKANMVLLKTRATIARRMAILGIIKWQN